jgi:myosin V
LIEGRLGVLALLDEESRLPSGTDTSFLQKLHNQLDKPENKDVFKKPRFGNTAFTIAHYAVDVTYQADGFIEKNRDTVPDEHLALLASTKNRFLKEVLDAALTSAKPSESPNPTSPAFSDSGSGSSRRSSVIPDPGRSSLVSSGTGASGTGGAGPRRPGAVAKKPTLGSIFKGSLANLMETLGVTNVHYIRCIKPNEQKRAWEFAPQQVLGQLRACGVLETIRISCAGYPSRWTYEEFVERHVGVLLHIYSSDADCLRYYMLVNSKSWGPMIKKLEIKPLCDLILKTTILDEDKYQSGLTKIFFRAGMLAAMESLRSERLNTLVTIVQKNMRRRMAVKKYQEMRQAAIRIQTWWRGILAKILVENVRREVAAQRLQKAVRSYIQRQQFLAVRYAVIRLQSREHRLNLVHLNS